MMTTIRRLTLAFGALALPALISAQTPAGPRAAVRGAGQADVTRILNARRALDLTPRQVAQLDSIERAQFAARRADQERMRQFRDTLRGDVRRRAGAGVPRDSIRAQAQARMQALRPQLEQARRRDSAARAAAERVLTDAQRQRVREMQAEARGYQRGMREGRGVRGVQPRQGVRGQPGLRGTPGARRAPQRPLGMQRPLQEMRRPPAPPRQPRQAPPERGI
jgi:hypothetical protein